MKKTWIIIVGVIIVLGIGYVLKNKLAGQSSQYTVPAQQTTTQNSSPAAPSNNIYMTKTDAEKGMYITDFQGMTLYTYDKDTAGVSNCYNGCAQAWPPYTSGATAQSQFPENITVITRTDGSKQFAWKGMPLYYYVSDQKAGDITGDGVEGVWHLIKQ